jgi:hypothetical protein
MLGLKRLTKCPNESIARWLRTMKCPKKMVDESIQMVEEVEK